MMTQLTSYVFISYNLCHSSKSGSTLPQSFLILNKLCNLTYLKSALASPFGRSFAAALLDKIHPFTHEDTDSNRHTQWQLPKYRQWLELSLQSSISNRLLRPGHSRGVFFRCPSHMWVSRSYMTRWGKYPGVSVSEQQLSQRPGAAYNTFTP